jgi:hypothetical protein
VTTNSYANVRLAERGSNIKRNVCQRTCNGQFKGSDKLYRVYANTFTTEAGDDIIAAIRTTLNNSSVIARRVHIVHDSAATIILNDNNIEIPLYVCADGKYRFETNLNEVQINSLKTKDAETGIYVLIIY